MTTPYDKSNQFGRDGYDAYGYDENGFDRDGYDAEGYDQYGFNQYGRDRAGRDRDGYYLDGYNDAGFDADGYDRAGFNRYGYDRTGHDRTGQRAPARPAEPTARDSAIGLLGGTAVTLTASGIVTALVVWLLRYMTTRTPEQVWDQLDSDPPLLPSPGTAALCAAGLALLAITIYVVMTVYTPGGAALFRLLVFLIGACLVIAMGNGNAAPTWIASLLIVAAGGAAISQLVPSIGPRIPAPSALSRKEP